MKRWWCNYLTQHLGVLAPLLAKMENCGGTWTDIQGQPSMDWPSQKPLGLVEPSLPVW